MDVIIVEGREVIKCEHCKGTTMCQHAQWDYTGDKARYRCSFCGDGIEVKTGFISAKGHPPVCQVCGGRGYNTI